MNQEELLWNEYKQQVDLYKFYLELTIKTNTFYYAITGAILSFYFASSGKPNMQYSLLLPLLMSILLAILFFYGAYANKISRQNVINIVSALNLQAFPELNILSYFLNIFGAVMVVVALSLFAILLCPVF